ncbi:coproporphyrinogen III oxidase, anaerobic [Desulfitobacterium dichloroeliminans LMG P-21439]|uniref:Coproporphyrinogen III oxidase, anaerobic n=1 Tax=Desulfitobacterium dichloroeliminans (strain LMG P-21439 / DCA1) TaxID=871963 RepID=L0F7W7_DESDL|nr:coproporphyrinogen dehydrogenase HemZ [Desulfitobacterium dichloroeliminans]AGA69929.1 coproporphyrinogen III oxidase, anaerobic [Desulfitobacterium dichloroeliminans LMG P-21439]
MNIILKSNTLSRSELAAGLSLCRAFFPEALVRLEEEGTALIEERNSIDVNQGDTDFALPEIEILHIDIHYPETPWRIEGYFRGAIVVLDVDDVQAILAHPYAGKESLRKLLLKRGILALLPQIAGHTPPWGILTGIRPSKILHRLNDAGYTLEEREKSLQRLYGVREDKAHLLQEVVSIQQPYLKMMRSHPNHVAIYVGIPFCPTRCSYCSFPAYSLKRGREPLEQYLVGLGEEIRTAGEWMGATGLVADSIYLGGGTPTVLTTSEISQLIALIMNTIPAKIEVELTVEAGRPDTLSQEKLLALRESGVNRLSINPQTMHNRTLQRIGRAHTVEDILRVYRLARKIPDWVINMDLIMGLPGEGVKDIQETLEQIKILDPDNLTVHALAIKRGSKEHEQGLPQNLGSELEVMQEVVMTSARSMGMQPYYLYRQKHIAGNLENIGLAKPGLECRYNIGIMEEQQNVIGMGAGASSKIVNPVDFSLINFHHPSDWQVYLKRWGEIQRKRAENLKHISKGY